MTIQHDDSSNSLRFLSADAILATDWPEPVWAIPELLPAGLTILAGAPKVGKSWLGLQIARAVAAGGQIWGTTVQQGPVMYLALEDPPRRLKSRMEKQGWQPGLPAHFMPIGNFVDAVGDLVNGGGEKLARQIEVQRYRLVVIDTLSRAVGGDQNDVAVMTRGLVPLQVIAHRHSCAVLLLDHHRKPGSFDSDVIADILGSTGKGAVADTIWGLYKERGKAGAKLTVTGRDICEKNLALMMDWQMGIWRLEGDADALEITERRQEILDALKDLGRATATQVAKATGRDVSNTTKRLKDLVNAGMVKLEGEYYSLLPDGLWTVREAASADKGGHGA